MTSNPQESTRDVGGLIERLNRIVSQHEVEWQEAVRCRMFHANQKADFGDDMGVSIHLLSEAASQLAALKAENERLHLSLETAIQMATTSAETALAQKGRAERAEAQLKAKDEALAPFADRADRYNEVPGLIRFDDSVELWQVDRNKGLQVDITIGDLRRARAALPHTEPKP